MESNKTVNVSGLFTTLLLVAFIVMKLAGVGVVATWSWLWVLSPFWIPLSIGCFGLFLYVLMLITRKKPTKRPTVKSKWQERYDMMMEQQRKAAERRNVAEHN